MASVFLSYDHEDSARAAPIAAALEAHGHSVWWDRHIHGGAEYNSEIEGAVERAHAVIVLWSQSSVRSAWVRDEAAEGRDAGKLIPVLIDGVKPPMGFRQYQAIDLGAWSGGKRIARLPELLNAVETVAKTGPDARGTRIVEPKPLPRQPKQLARSEMPPVRVSRRLLIGGGAAAAARREPRPRRLSPAAGFGGRRDSMKTRASRRRSTRPRTRSATRRPISKPFARCSKRSPSRRIAQGPWACSRWCRA